MASSRSHWLRRRLSMALWLAAMGLLAPHVAHAGDKEEARHLALKGIELYQQGQHQDALNALLVAEANFHAPPHMLYIARARRELGRAGEAYDEYVTLAQETLPPGSPQPFLDAQRTARKELAELEPHVRGIRVELSGAGQSSAVISVDGRRIARERLEYALPLPTGEHVVRARSPEGNTEQTITLGPAGPPLVVKLQVGDAPSSSPPVGATASGEQTPDAVPPSDGGPLDVLGVTALVLGGASVAVGAVTGALTLSRASDIKATCQDDGTCPKEQETEADSAKILGTVSTVTFIAGGALVAIGFTMLLIDSSAGDTDSARTATIKLRAGPSGLWMQGAF